MHILNNGGQKIVISFLLCVWSAQICSPRLDLFFNRKVFSFNLTSFFIYNPLNSSHFSFLFLNSYFVTMNLVVIFNNNGIAVRWICQILIMLSTVSYRLSKHGRVAHAYVLRGSVLRPIPLYCTWLSTIINILLYSPSLIAAVGHVVKS